MKKTYLALAFLITGFLLAGDAYGEDEVYYCSVTGRGFDYSKESGSYEPARFEDLKFKFMLDRASKIIVVASEVESMSGLYNCKAPYLSSRLSCVYFSHHLNFNPENGRVAFFMGAGYVGNDGDSLVVAYGKCDKF